MPKLKPLNEQVIVITGASSGIGLATAQKAARRGAKVVLAARNHDALKQIADEINQEGGDAAYVVADVGVAEDVERIAETAVQRYGGFDTWVNDAGVGIFGKAEQVNEDDARRLFDTNFWGVVNGSRTAVRHLKGRGGAVINIGSVESDVAVPLQGVYAASKHAVKAFTDALRAELHHDGAPISVTLVKPGAIGSPMLQHFKNEMDQEGRFPPPLYRPEDVALVILHAAQHPERELYVGGAAKLMSVANKTAPGLFGALGGLLAKPAQTQDAPNPGRPGNLYAPGEDGRVRGEHPGWVRPSLSTHARLHPVLTGAALLTGLLAAAAILERKQLARAVRHGRPLATRLGDQIGDAVDWAGERMGGAGERVGEAVGWASERMSGAGGRLADTAERVGGGLSTAMDRAGDTARRVSRGSRAKMLRRGLHDLRQAAERARRRA